MYRIKLARTLLVLGVGVSPACERIDGEVSAKPLIDRNHSPAVGNLGQTGRPIGPRPARVRDRERPAAVAVVPTPRPRPVIRRPVVNQVTRPAVGNIGQTGAPAVPHSINALQAVVIPPTPEIVRPRVTREYRPAVGNTVTKGRRRPETEIAVERPLVTAELRPAVGNVLDKCGDKCRRDGLIDHYKREVTHWDAAMVTAATERERLQARVNRDEAKRLLRIERAAAQP
jgi:hypothetical protein